MKLENKERVLELLNLIEEIKRNTERVKELTSIVENIAKKYKIDNNDIILSLNRLSESVANSKDTLVRELESL